MYNYWNYAANPYQTAQAAQMQYQQAQQQLQQMQAQHQAQSQPLQQSMPVVSYVCGIEGAKAFVVPAGNTYYLLDSESPHLFFKTSDAQGKSTIKKFLLTEVDLTEKPAAQDAREFATKKDLDELRQAFEAQIKSFGGIEQIAITKPQGDIENV